MFRRLVLGAVTALSVLSISTIASAQAPRYVGVGITGNIDATSQSAEDLAGTVRVQVPINEQVSVSGNIFAGENTVSGLPAVNYSFSPVTIADRAFQPRVGLGANILGSNSQVGVLGNRTSPVVNAGVDYQATQRAVVFADAYYVPIGYEDVQGDKYGSVALVGGVGFSF